MSCVYFPPPGAFKNPVVGGLDASVFKHRAHSRQTVAQQLPNGRCPAWHPVLKSKGVDSLKLLR
jgi:hypothetical protein